MNEHQGKRSKFKKQCRRYKGKQNEINYNQNNQPPARRNQRQASRNQNQNQQCVGQAIKQENTEHQWKDQIMSSRPQRNKPNRYSQRLADKAALSLKSIPVQDWQKKHNLHVIEEDKGQGIMYELFEESASPPKCSQLSTSGHAKLRNHPLPASSNTSNYNINSQSQCKSSSQLVEQILSSMIPLILT